MRRFAPWVSLSLLLAACSTTAPAPTATGPPSKPAAATTTTPATVAPTAVPPATTAPVTAYASETIGHSTENRQLQAATIGAGPIRVYVVGAIHGDERAAVENSPALLDSLGAAPPPGLTVRWLLDANPDGTAANTRDNAAGVDLNRNWPTADFLPAAQHGDAPLSEPETSIANADIVRFDPDLIVALHAAREGPFVDFDGPGESAAAAFAAGASGAGRTWVVAPTVAWPTPGSLGTYFGEEQEVPVVTVEASRWDDTAVVLHELEAGLRTLFDFLVDRGPAPAAEVCADLVIGHSCSDLTRHIEAAIADAVVTGGYGFLVAEVEGSVLAAWHADLPFYPAGALDVVHAVRLLGGHDLDTMVPVHDDACSVGAAPTVLSLRELMMRTLVEPDAAAANAIQDHIGLDALTETIGAAGMVDTAIHHRFGCGGPANDPANQTTAADLVALYQEIATGRLLPGTDLFDIMLDVTDRVPAPRGSQVVVGSGDFGGIRAVGGFASIPDDGGRYAFAAFANGVHEPVGWIVDTVVAEMVRGLAARPG